MRLEVPDRKEQMEGAMHRDQVKSTRTLGGRGLLGGVEEVWGGLLREQKGRFTAQPQLGDVLGTHSVLHADSLQSSPG